MKFMRSSISVESPKKWKSFIGITLDVPEDDRIEGSLAANVIGLQKGVSVFRVHDVNQTRKALTIAKKILNSQQYIS